MTYSHYEFKGSPVEAADAREKALAEGLHHLATCCGKSFQGPLQINSRGEFSLVMNDPGIGRDGGQALIQTDAGRYGELLASILSPHGPRTGIAPARSIHPFNGWCSMSHFDVQAMLEQFEATQRTFVCKFYGRKAGALGICGWIEGVQVFSVSTFEKIRIAVYNAGYEHVSSLTYTILETP